MAKRVFEIAKELGIASKAVVAKCQAEGIPESVIKNHMSSVSVGLEATIREWFAESSEEVDAGGTAVETAAKVDVAKVRARPRRATRARAARAGEDEDSSTDEAEATAVETAEPEADEPTPPAPDDAPAEETPEPEAGDDNGADATKLKIAPRRQSPSTLAPVGTKLEVPQHDRSDARSDRELVQTPRKIASAEEHAAAAERQREAEPAKPTPTVAPAPMNVPTRPKIVTPAGPQLEQKASVKLSGPKVVRVEAPERLEPPRPRRAPEGGGFGGRGAPMGPDVGDPSRSGGGGATGPRRGGGPSKRRTTTGDRDRPSRTRGHGEEWTGNIYSEADLAEREARLQRAGGFMKQRRQQARRGPAGDRQSLAQTGGKVRIAEPFTIKDLSAATGVKSAEIVKKLFMQGVMATANSGIDAEKAQEILFDYNIELEVTAAKSAEDVITEQFGGDRELLDERPRGPVVTILGHVDHGKTSLLDKIRNAKVAAGEAGGITQATSAFRVPVQVGDATKEVVFIDTPGHEAFTAMRSRGAQVTDVCVIVVAADDGVMPQTIESIAHAKAAGTPIVVALNKIDKAEATDSNIQRILGQLAERELNPVEWGGDTEVVKTSAHTGEGIQELLEILDYQAELLELKADFGGHARGNVIESRQEPGRGVVANILVTDGQLKVGDFIVAGRGFGRVRDITNDRGQRLKEAAPPMPVQISGLDEIPDAGDPFFVVDSLKKAQEAAEQRRDREREAQLAQPKVTLDTLLSQMKEVDLKEILVVLKADVQGSVDVLKHEIEKVSTDEVKIRVLHSAVGGITESDVILAEASKAVIIGFNVIPSGKARSLADNKGVEIRTYDVIYHITEDVQKAAEGMLEPELRQEVLGHAEVRQVFRVSKVGMIAGCYVTDGVIQRDALIRVTRGDIVIENDRRLEQLKRFKDDAKEVRNGLECGMKIVGYDDIKEGDILECYKQVEVKRTL